MDNVGGYSAWRWIFILEGLLTLLVATVAFFVLPDWPEQARFLSESEKSARRATLAADTKELVETKSTMTILKECVSDPKVLCRYGPLVFWLLSPST